MEQKNFFNVPPRLLEYIILLLPPLVIKAWHLSGSAFAGLGLPEQAMGWFPLRFGIGSRRWTY